MEDYKEGVELSIWDYEEQGFLGLCKCLSIFLFLMGAGNITTTTKMRMTMDGSKVAEFQGVTCYKSGYIEYMWSEYCFIFISSVESENTIEKHLLSKEKCRGRCTGVKRSLKNNLPSSRMKEEEEIETTTRSLTRELTLSRYESIYKYILSFDPSPPALQRLFLETYRNSVSISISIQPLRSLTSKVFTIGEVVKPCSNRVFVGFPLSSGDIPPVHKSAGGNEIRGGYYSRM